MGLVNELKSKDMILDKLEEKIISLENRLNGLHKSKENEKK